MTWFTSTKPSYFVKILHLQVLSESDGLSESQFNDMVHKYKTKLFGKDTASSSAKRERGIE